MANQSIFPSQVKTAYSRKAQVQSRLKTFFNQMIPDSKKSEFTRIAKKHLNEEWNEIQELKQIIDSEPKDFQSYLQKLNRYYELNKRLIIRVTILIRFK